MNALVVEKSDLPVFFLSFFNFEDPSQSLD